jgi:hypothetical protein
MSCEKTSYLIEKRELSKLSLGEKFSMRFHLLWCRLCQKYASDSKILGKILKALHKHEGHAQLSPSDKDEMKKKLASS